MQSNHDRFLTLQTCFTEAVATTKITDEVFHQKTTPLMAADPKEFMLDYSTTQLIVIVDVDNVDVASRRSRDARFVEEILRRLQNNQIGELLVLWGTDPLFPSSKRQEHLSRYGPGVRHASARCNSVWQVLANTVTNLSRQDPTGKAFIVKNEHSDANNFLRIGTQCAASSALSVFGCSRREIWVAGSDMTILPRLCDSTSTDRLVWLRDEVDVFTGAPLVERMSTVVASVSSQGTDTTPCLGTNYRKFGSITTSELVKRAKDTALEGHSKASRVAGEKWPLVALRANLGLFIEADYNNHMEVSRHVFPEEGSPSNEIDNLLMSAMNDSLGFSGLKQLVGDTELPGVDHASRSHTALQALLVSLAWNLEEDYTGLKIRWGDGFRMTNLRRVLEAQIYHCRQYPLYFPNFTLTPPTPSVEGMGYDVNADAMVDWLDELPFVGTLAATGPTKQISIEGFIVQVPEILSVEVVNRDRDAHYPVRRPVEFAYADRWNSSHGELTPPDRLKATLDTIEKNIGIIREAACLEERSRSIAEMMADPLVLTLLDAVDILSHEDDLNTSDMATAFRCLTATDQGRTEDE